MIVEAATEPILPRIVDASVVVKWLLEDEDLLPEARAVRSSAGDLRLALGAPSVLWSELVHSLVRAVRRGRIDPGSAQVLAGELADLRPIISDQPVDGRDAVRIALTVGVSAYDAQYLALSAALAVPVLTADRGMLDRGLAHGYDVLWLGDVATPEIPPGSIGDEGVPSSDD